MFPLKWAATEVFWQGDGTDVFVFNSVFFFFFLILLGHSMDKGAKDKVGKIYLDEIVVFNV